MNISHLGHPNRRQAVQAIGNLAVLGAASVAMGGCESLFEQIRRRPTRRSLRTMAPNDPALDIYRAAVSAMKALPASDRRSWNAQAQIHFDHCPHGNWFFLPWHRAYLLYFEQICRQLTGESSFGLPYWNWTCQRQLPAPFLGDASNPLFSTGRGGVPPAQLADEIVGTALMDEILDETNFIMFASDAATALRPPVGYGLLEGTPHNSVHGFVGGVMGGFQSPRDPIFWMHHNMIERIWWDWNVVRGNANTNDAAWNNFSLGGMFADRTGALVDNLTVGLLNLAPLLSYQFDNDGITSCLLRFNPWVIRDEVALRRLLEFGGKVELRRSRTLARIEPFEIALGAAATRALDLRNAPALAGITRKGPLRLLLRITPAEQPATGEYFVRVFVGLPQAGVETSTNVPQFAGSFAFFNDPQAHGHHASGAAETNAAFVVDLGSVLDRLRASGAAFGDSLNIQMVAVPMNRRPDTRALRVAGLELLLAESSTPPQQRTGSEGK